MPRSRIPHRIVHTRNKHSRAVLQGDTVIIRLARNLSRSEEQEHIQSLLRRMTKIVLEERQKIVIHPFRSLLEGADRCIVRTATGKGYFFHVQPGEKTLARRNARGWTITVSPRVDRKRLHRFLWKLLSVCERTRIAALIENVNRESFGVRVSATRLEFAASQWGSCSPRGVIMVNAALLFLPPRLLKYIVVHELAHRVRADHSPAFWRVVERVMPGYDAARQELMEYRLPTL